MVEKVLVANAKARGLGLLEDVEEIKSNVLPLSRSRPQQPSAANGGFRYPSFREAFYLALHAHLTKLTFLLV